MKFGGATHEQSTLLKSTTTVQRPSRSRETTTNQLLNQQTLDSLTSSISSIGKPSSPDKNPIKAYLRIRPLSSATQNQHFSYLKVLNDQHVSLIPPEDSNAYRKRQGACDQYQFTKVFVDNASQQQVFEETTLPLVQSFINGNNALIFAYGVTNSGKTYTMLGNETDAGIIPRTLHALFDSLQDHMSDAALKPMMHSGIQMYERTNDPILDDEHENRSLLPDTMDTTDYTMKQHMDSINRLEVDSSFEYGIWVSFAEIYNEQIFDLLESSTPSSKNNKCTKRTSLPLKYEHRTGYKYIAGLKHVRVKNADEAYTVVQIGQKNRVVFSTLMNQSSSRSHSIFTISLVRCPIDKKEYVIEDPTYATISKLSVVDLAGSERYRHTFNQGLRLKEAGNINKSLMVLGQCMETLRMNQLKIENGKRPAIVPFRQSKLTELFKNTFEGHGKAAIIVNVNPFDTGFDENSHVMKFAAIAKEVTTSQQHQPKLPVLDDSAGPVRKRLRRNQHDPDMNGKTQEQYHDDPFVNSILEQMETLRDKWLEAETKCITMEVDIRQQVSMETKSEVEKMENMYMSLLKRQNETVESEIENRLQGLGTVEDDDTEQMNKDSNEHDQVSLAMLKAKQQHLSSEIDKICLWMKDQNNEKNKLLEKMTELQKDKIQEQATIKRLHSNITQLKAVIDNYRNNSTSSSTVTTHDHLSQTTSIQHESLVSEENETELAETSDQYSNFLQLRKQLRRSVFKREELLEDAEGIIYDIEQFQNVTFDLVKHTKMGKLLKLITQEEFQSDPYLIQYRAMQLLKRFARLPRSNNQVSSDAGNQEAPYMNGQHRHQEQRKLTNRATPNDDHSTNELMKPLQTSSENGDDGPMDTHVHNRPSRKRKRY
ncbi:P-loop containing nucleoside triphosphate hydrolase protein [Halteromyces radiatus]|uniref:P-loop containing nucleoside triphosphate hydrolase protein n=1 Tax=Halteromyces radiatus TaxID=101107 RepID=UPI00222039E1|nr:P-loop containing nucleoside triphosphate hydrolase protein [Halteromyces radiatus]KAI8096189.1 P-loop containing nucleoside triphosphate hydrolase protein [Halteromyces radiatus]